MTDVRHEIAAPGGLAMTNATNRSTDPRSS